MPTFGHEASVRVGGGGTTYRKRDTSDPVERALRRKGLVANDARMLPPDNNDVQSPWGIDYTTNDPYYGDTWYMPGGTGGGHVDVMIPNRERLDELRAKRLESALALIAAEFGTREGELEAKILDLEALYPRLVLENTQQSEQTERQVQNAMGERGIYRSGISARTLTDALQPLVNERAQIEAEYNPRGGDDGEGSKIRDLLSQLELLAQEKAAAEAAAKTDAEYDELDLETMIALAEAGLA